MSVIPLFVLMAIIVSNTGIGEDLYRSANAWVGALPGGLAMATSAACAAFAAICGTSTAGTITMGKVAVPEMRKFHYDESLNTASVAAGGTLGILIPPSILLIVYAATAGVSAAPGVGSSKYGRPFLPSTLAVSTCGKRRMYALWRFTASL